MGLTAKLYKSNPEQNLCMFSETKVIYVCTPMQITKHSLYGKTL